MGEVYRALDTRLDRIVAVKILPSRLSEDHEAKERFDREARTISQLDHPHICALHDVGEQDGTAFLIMQYLEGETLAGRLARGLAVYNDLRTEVTLGQYLDVLAAHSRRVTEEEALTVNRFKTASYTVQRPIQLGLALACAPHDLVRAVSAYAIPAGIAFQLRDDVLGAFGDPEVTGKPSGEDLRERKPTWLWARTTRLCPEAEGITDVDRLRDLIVDSGALADAEAKIGTLVEEALAAARELDVAEDLVCELVDMTVRLAWRRS